MKTPHKPTDCSCCTEMAILNDESATLKRQLKTLGTERDRLLGVLRNLVPEEPSFRGHDAADIRAARAAIADCEAELTTTPPP